MKRSREEVTPSPAAGIGSLLGRDVVSTATFAGFSAEGRFMVSFAGNAQPLIALAAVSLGADDVGAPVLIAYADGDGLTPIIVGRLRERAEPAAVAKGEGRTVIQAEREIELRCGDASIVLTRAGKVLIRGNYVVSRSRGANKIKGASVGIN